MLDTRATYHACPNRDWFSSFEKIDGCSIVMRDDHSCTMEAIDTVHIKMFDGTVWKLKDVRYVPQPTRNLISIGVLKVLGLKVSVRDGVVNMIKGSMVVLKGVRRTNLYYLKGSMVTGQVTTSTNSNNDYTQL